MQTKKKLVLSKETLRNLQPAEMRMAVGGGFDTVNLITMLVEYSLGHCSQPLMCAGSEGGCPSGVACDTDPAVGCLVTTGA